jgi:transposase InsO family protein
MHEHENEFSVPAMARVLKVSASGYYRWRDAGPGRRELHRKELERGIREIHRSSRKTYGSPRIFYRLKKCGYRCSLTSVADIMREAGIRAKASRKYKATTNSRHREAVSPNLVPQGTCAIGPDLIWLSDVTYIRTTEGWLYLCVFLDLYSRKAVGWAVSDRNNAELVMLAFWRALKVRRPGTGLIVHSDRGSQYASKRLRAMLAGAGCVQSMSRKGNCFDNAVCESFFHSLKVELDRDRRYRSRADARSELFDYIEGFYNGVRIHSALGYLSPIEYELRSKSS